MMQHPTTARKIHESKADADVAQSVHMRVGLKILQEVKSFDLSDL